MSAAAEDSLKQATNAVADYCPTINLPVCLSGVDNVESPFLLLQQICSRQKDLMVAPTNFLREAVLYATRDIVDAVVSQLWTSSRSQLKSADPDGDTEVKLVELRAVIPRKVQSTLQCLLLIRWEVENNTELSKKLGEGQKKEGIDQFARQSTLENLLKALELLRQLFDDLTELFALQAQQRAQEPPLSRMSYDGTSTNMNTNVSTTLQNQNGATGMNMNNALHAAALQRAQMQMSGGPGSGENPNYSLFDNIPAFNTFDTPYGMGRDPKSHYSLFADPAAAKHQQTSWMTSNMFPAETRNLFAYQQQQNAEQPVDKFYQRSSAMSIPAMDGRNYNANVGHYQQLRNQSVEHSSPRSSIPMVRSKSTSASPQQFYSSSLPTSAMPTRNGAHGSDVLQSAYEQGEDAFNFDSMAESLLVEGPYDDAHTSDAYYGSSVGSGSLAFSADSSSKPQMISGDSFVSAVRRRESVDTVSPISPQGIPGVFDPMEDADDMTGWVEPPVRYKTAMCKRIIDSSKCRYSKACGFAHSEGEKDNFSRLHLATVKCQFGRKCRNPTCGRAHTPQAQQDAMALYAEAVGSCRLIVGNKS